MDEKLLKSVESKKYLDDQVRLSPIEQLCINPSVCYAKEVDDAVLFMDDSLKILATSPYAKSLNNMHKIDDISARLSSYAITEYFNVMYYDKMLTHGSKSSYSINDTKNGIKHLSLLAQTFENIAQHASAFTIGKITWKWEKLHKALI